MDKVYEPQKYEAEIYKKWEEAGTFAPQGSGKPFAIIMPPPNANGALHWGHAIGYSLTDIITRQKRMQGFKTLWLPGTDHAGIETQVVFERRLAKEGRSRFDLGPQTFYQEALAFTLASENTILNQMRSMGFSADWKQKKFTLDEDITAIVYETFKQMHADGLVYRGNRLINWCTHCLSGFADIELSHQEREDKLYTLDYGPLKIATTRPETIFADVAVAVNPIDKRYKDTLKQGATIPLVERPIPIISDEAVEIAAGTGALKVTPGHDPVDYEIGKRHNLPEITVIDQDGKLVNVPDEFAGLSVEEGRQKVVASLKRAGRLVSEESLRHTVAVHERCGTVIEPLISEQWFLRIKPLNAPVIKAIKEGTVEFFPARYKKIALNWLENEHDWNISRQNWFGIRMPVYYKTSNDPSREAYLITTSEEEAKAYYGEGNYRAETDTFDTWFSSGQWPFATLMSTGQLGEFYPTDLMGTARDLLHRWVTRMIMFGLYRTGKVPFKNVYLWGLVTDEHGAKMSKSKGNVVDPLDMITKYGADALRLAGAIANTPGLNSPMSESRVIAYRNFVNKLWNASRFSISKLGGSNIETGVEPQTLADKWFLHTLGQQAQQISTQIESYRLNEAANRIYHLLWSEFADWYIETAKVSLNAGLLMYGLENILKLAHPFVPFVTEAVWSHLPGRNSLLVSAPWPEIEQRFPEEAAQFETLKSLISEVRTIKAELDLGTAPFYFSRSPLIAGQAELIKALAGTSEVSEVKDGRGLPLLSGQNNAWLGVDDVTIKAYRQKLEQKLEATKRYAEGLLKQIENRDFIKSAPAEVVESAKRRQDEAQNRLSYIQKQIDKLAA